MISHHFTSSEGTALQHSIFYVFLSCANHSLNYLVELLFGLYLFLGHLELIVLN